MAAAEERLSEWMRLVADLEGICLCPEAAACVGVLEEALAEGSVRPEETAIIFNPGAAQKYVEVIGTADPARTAAGQPLDWWAVAGEPVAPPASPQASIDVRHDS